MVNKDLNEVNTFLDNLPSDPCKMKKPEALCSLCEKLNEDVYAACQERERDSFGLLLDMGGFTDIENTIEAPVAVPEAPPEDGPAMVKKVSDTISFEFHKSTEPPAPEPTAVPEPEPPAPPAPPAEAGVPQPDGVAVPPPPPPPPPPPAGDGAPDAAPAEGAVPEKPPGPPTERIEVRDRSTGLAIEFVPKKKHFKAKPKDALWDDIMGGETLFRTIMDEYIPPPEPEAVEVEEAIEELGEFPMEGEVAAVAGEDIAGEAMAAEAVGEEEIMDIEVLEIDVIEEETAPELGPEFAEATGHYDAANYDLALASYDTLITEDPNRIDALIGRGRTLRMLSRYEEALTVLDTAIEKAPERSDAVRERDLVLDRMASVDFAVLKDQADSFFKEERYAEALVMYDKAIEIAPNDTHVLNNKALTLRHLERYEEARETYEETLRIDPEDLKARKGLEKTSLAISQVREKPEEPAGDGAPEAPEAPAVEGAGPEAPVPPEDEKPVAKKKVITPERKAELEAEGIEVVPVDVMPEKAEETAPSIKLPAGALIGPGAPITPVPAGEAKPEEGKKGRFKKGKKEKKGKAKKGGKTPPAAPPAGKPVKPGKRPKAPKKGRKGKAEVPTLAPVGLEPVTPKEKAGPAVAEVEVEPVAVESAEPVVAPAPVRKPMKKKALRPKKPVLKPREEAPALEAAEPIKLEKKKALRPKKPVLKPKEEAPALEATEPAELDKKTEKPVWKKKRARPKPKAPMKKPEAAAPVLEPAPVEEAPGEITFDPVEAAPEPKPKMKFKKGAVAKPPRPSKPKKSFMRPKPEKPASTEEPELLILEATPAEEKPVPKPKMRKKKAPKPVKAPAPEPLADDTVFQPIEADEPIQGEVLLEPEPEPSKEKKKEDVLDWGDLEELVAEVSDDEDDLL